MSTILQPPPRNWECGSGCGAWATTDWDTPNRFHHCRALAGILAPMVLVGSGARVRTVEREDYVGTEDVRYDGRNRPVMSVVTDRPDGSNDTMVFAPAARGAGQGAPHGMD